MKRTELKFTVIAIALLTIAGLTPQKSWACTGTFRPNCGQTAWLAKFVTSSIVLPGTGADITVPIGVLPYALWNPASPCAQPNTGALELTLTCTAVGGGAAIVIGPKSVPTGVPSAPGPQPVLTGAGGTPVVGGPFVFPISGGTLPVGTSYSCLIEGTYSVGFGIGTGSSLITGVGDTEVCIVEEAPGAPGIPRFDFRLIDTGDGPFSVVRRGDQAYNSYLAANNDPNESLDLTINSTTNQVARFPSGPDPDNTLFALSHPAAGTDNFAESLLRGFPPGGLLPLPDPVAPNSGLSFKRVLGPHGLRITTIVTRPHGMCADGSCSEALVKATGMYGNGDLILGCAGTAIVVDDVLAKSHQCEITDTLQTADTVDSFWSRATFDNDEHMATNHAGNLDPETYGFSATQTTGSILADEFNIIGSPPTATDYLRTEHAPNMVNWSMDGFDQAAEFALQHMDVYINNLSSPEFTIRVPLIAKDGEASNLRINLDASNDHVTVIDSLTDQTLYDGYLPDLVNSPPAGISIQNETYREITKAGPSPKPLLGTIPLSHTSLHAPTDPPDSMNANVLDPRNNQPLAWNASSDNNLVTLSKASGNAGEDIIVNYDPATIAASPEITIALVEVANAQALNSPVFLPIALRTTTTPSAQTQDINYGMIGSWFNEDWSGQGLLFDFNPDSQFIFGAEFTDDIMSPQPGGDIPGAEQRWFTFQGNYRGNRAEFTIYQTRNGIFDDPAAVTTMPVGSGEFEAGTCTKGRVTFDLPHYGLSGVYPVTKLLGDEFCTRINDGQIVAGAAGTGGSASSHTKQSRPAPQDSHTMQDINYGMIGSWYNALTSGQGLLFDFITASQFMFVAAFTFDTFSPQQGGTISGAEQRWFTAQGNYAGNRADLTIYQTRNGVFHDPTDVDTTAVGTLIIEFISCTSANITYDLPGLGLSGEIPVTKLLGDVICTQISDGDIAAVR